MLSLSSFQATPPTTPSTTTSSFHHQQQQRSKKKQKSSSISASKCRRESVLKPSVYQKIQKKRKSQTLITNNQRLTKIHIDTEKRLSALSFNPIELHLANRALYDEESDDASASVASEVDRHARDVMMMRSRSRPSSSHARNCRHLQTTDIERIRPGSTKHIPVIPQPQPLRAFATTPMQLPSNSNSHSHSHSSTHSFAHSRNPPKAPNCNHRRCVFLSLQALYDGWRRVPASVLFDAIFMLPLHREWIVSPPPPKPSSSNAHGYAEMLSDAAFLTLLRWKDQQGLMVYVLHELDAHRTLQSRLQRQQQVDSHCVAPFWYNVSRKLQTMFDPDTGDVYRPLMLNERWWKYAYSSETHSHSLYYSQFNVSTDAVLDELRFVTLKFQAMQEILYQSNPSLIVLASYDSQIRAQSAHTSAGPKPTQNEAMDTPVPPLPVSQSHAQTPSLALSLDSMSNTQSNTPSQMMTFTPSPIASQSHTLQLEAIQSILSQPQQRRKLSQLDEEEDIEVVNMMSVRHVGSQLGSQLGSLTCGTLATLLSPASPTDDDDDDDDSGSGRGSGTGSNCTFDEDADDDEDDEQDDIEEHLIKYRLSESTSMLNSHDELEDSHSTSCSPRGMFADLRFDDSQQTMARSSDTDGGDNDVDALPAVQRRTQPARKSVSQTDTCTRSPSNSSSRCSSSEPSLHSLHTNDDDMEWWICPQYYYDARQVDTVLGIETIDYDD